MTVCLRPFRAAGPRIEAERIGDKRVVHNYGHGGSGWSLSWGSAQIVRDLAMQGGTTDIAVIGCGALGLTAATTLQRAGAKVTIYAADRLPQTRSARATGPVDAGLAHRRRERVDAGFPELWERDGPRLLGHAPDLGRPAGRAGGLPRSLHPVNTAASRRLRRRCRLLRPWARQRRPLRTRRP
jgi:glycine/D-amino acid oxidase-like deaminating enzyme